MALTFALLLVLLAGPAAAAAVEPAPGAAEPAPAAPAEPGASALPLPPDATPAPPAALEEPEPAAELIPPRPVTPLTVPFPEGQPPLVEPVEVEVMLRISATGEVTAVEVVRSGGAPFDAAVIAAVTAVRFEPARFRGEVVEVEVPFLQRFEPEAPAPPAAAEGPALTAEIRGHVVEKGTRSPLTAARVTASHDAFRATVEVDAEGAFSLPIPAGPIRIEVDAPGFKRFLTSERLQEDERLELRLLVERISFGGFEAVVIGKADRVEVARTTLRDREIHHVPGTFGDPFRVIGTLPGVGQVFSLLGYPLVRGTSPGNTGFLIDGVRVPQLFHFLAGPSVIHPEFIERVDFYPGSFPVQYGGYTGGIVDGITRRAGPDESRLDIDLDLLQSGMLYREPVGFLDATGTLAGRIGYPGLLLSTFSSDAFASYWDYQGRLDGSAGGGNYSLFAFGSFDELGTRVDGEDVVGLRYSFHRFDAGWRRGDEEADLDSYASAFGVDQLFSGDGGPTLTTLSATPRSRWYRRLSESLQLRTGLDAGGRYFTAPIGDESGLELDSWAVNAGAFVDTPWKVSGRLLLTPGVRADAYHNDRTSQTSVDPRLLARYTLQKTDEQTTWLKSGIGWYHQPPRFFIPVPGLEDFALSQGLLASAQLSAGVEREWAAGYSVDLQSYFHYMDPILFDLAINTGEEEPPVEPQPGDPRPPPPGTEPLPEEPPEANAGGTAFDLLAPRIGRAYGLELLVRKKQQGDLFGWLSYTLSRSERRIQGAWVPFDFDRTHMVSLVAGLRLPRSWELGGRVQFQTGRPVDEELNRAPIFYRLDVRIDKRAVYQGWLLDFYIDITNVTLSAESLDDDPDGAIPYVLPTIGFRAVL